MISYDEIVALLSQVKKFDAAAVDRAVNHANLKSKGQLNFKEFKIFMEELFE